MIQPKVFSEQILFQTVRLACDGSIGTGCIFGFQVGPDKHVPVILTNKHVVDNQEINTVKFSLHLLDTDKTVSQRSVDFEWKSEWIFHPDEDIDLCCTLLLPMVEEARQNGMDVFYQACPEEFVKSQETLEDLQTVNDVIMVGYPDGLYDEKHCLPIVRKGMTATHPSIDHDGYPYGLIDIGCIYGSSGSPIYSYPGLYHYDKKSGFSIGGHNPILYGILFGMATTSIDGVVSSKKPSVNLIAVSADNAGLAKTEIPINLGFYIKAKEILILKEQLIKKYEIQ